MQLLVHQIATNAMHKMKFICEMAGLTHWKIMDSQNKESTDFQNGTAMGQDT